MHKQFYYSERQRGNEAMACIGERNCLDEKNNEGERERGVKIDSKSKTLANKPPLLRNKLQLFYTSTWPF